MSELPPIPTEPPVWPRIVKPVAFLLLPVLVIAGGWEGYRFVKLRLALGHARHEFANRQFMRAEFWANRAFNVDEKNVAATRLMAEINEAQDRPAALDWRIKVAQREPGNTADIMAWAKSAFRFGQVDMAVKALKSLPPDFPDHSAEYHELIAGSALATHEGGVAEAHFVKAVELDHDNPLHRVNLAAFRLTNSPSKEARTAAAQELETLLADSRVTLFAARALLADALRSKDRARVQRFAEKLHSLPERSFSDDLSCLEAAMPEPAFQPALQEIEHRAEADPALVNAAGDWLNAHGMAAETLRWFAQLPEAIRANVRVQITIAEAYLATKDWNGLQSFLAKCRWTDGEFLRRAMLIRCQRELAQPWEKDWKQLATDVDASPPDGLLLAQLVIGWKWRKETLELLWEAAARPTMGAKALQYLWDLYAQTNETRELLRVANAQIALDAANPARKNNAAFLSLLLYGASERSERLAREASIATPKVPEWVATYAYALHLSGKDAEAKKALESLPPEALNRPGIALYYTIVLAATGDTAKAKEFFVKVSPNGLLPEEQKLATNLAQQLKATPQ